MELTRETRMSKLATSTTAVKHLYTNEEAGAKYREVFDASGLPEEKYTNYVLTVGDVVLGFYPISELATLLKSNSKIDEQTAKKITADLIDFLSPLVNRSEENVAVSVPDPLTDTVPVAVTPPEPAQPAPEPAPVPEVEEPVVQPLRTMEHDMDRIHGYGAYRKMYPDPEVESAIPEPVTPQAQQATSPAPVPVPQEEKVIVATPQAETLSGSPTLTPTPTYTEEPPK